MTKTGALTITPAPAAPARILVVEDEAITAADLQDRLVQLGYEIAGWAVTGEDAIDLARNGQPDLVLMDIRLKGRMTGIEAAREIRAELRLPVIFLTANSNDAVVDEAKVSEPFAYLLKPFEERHLRANIEMAVHKARGERERDRLVRELQAALAEVKTLTGLLPICAWCKDVRDDEGYWTKVEAYVQKRSNAKFTHGICPSCAEDHCGEFGDCAGSGGGTA
jgi:two-component system, response regulator PdtaR